VPAAQQQMQQQVMLLKKQLAEFRANQALTEDISKQASMTRGNDQNLLMIEEKTAHYDTQSALDYSEETVRNLLFLTKHMVILFINSILTCYAQLQVWLIWSTLTVLDQWPTYL